MAEPNKDWVYLSRDTLIELHEILDSYGIGFIPPTQVKRDILYRHAFLSTRRVVTGGFSNAIIGMRKIPYNVNLSKSVQTPYQPGAIPARLITRAAVPITEITYLDCNGNLVYTYADEDTMCRDIMSVQQNILLYTPQELTSPAPRLYESGMAYEPYGMRIKLPEVIGDTMLDPTFLNWAIRGLNDIVKGVHSPKRLAEAAVPRRIQVYNNAEIRKINEFLAECGMTALEYIQARYAHIMLTEFQYDNRLEIGEVPRVYREVWRKLINKSGKPKPVRPTNKAIPKPNAGVYEIMTQTNRPSFEREPENENQKTFDRIRMAISVKSKNVCPNRNSLIRKYQQDFVKIALIKIDQNQQFQNFGVPVQFLKPVEMTITRDDQVEIIFELKL